MTTPVTGHLCGYDVGIRNPDTGRLQLDGKLDDLRYEINADNTGRVYRQNANGTQDLITDKVVFTDSLEGEYVMQFTADAAVTIDGKTLAPDKGGDVVVIRWHPERKFILPDPWIETFFFKGSQTFDALVASNPEWAANYRSDVEGIKTNPIGGSSYSSIWGRDVDGDGQDDPYHLEIYGGSTFVPISAIAPYGEEPKDGDGTFNARIGLSFTGNRCK